MKDYLNRNMLIHYSENKEPYTDGGGKFRSVLCRPNVHKYLPVKEYIKRNKIQRESFVSESNSCIGAFSNNKKEVNCKACLKKLNKNNEREINYKINMIKCNIRKTNKTAEKQQKKLERLYKQIEIVTGIELKRCDRCKYYYLYNENDLLYECIVRTELFQCHAYYIKSVSNLVDFANKCKYFCKKGNGNDKINIS